MRGPGVTPLLMLGEGRGVWTIIGRGAGRGGHDGGPGEGGPGGGRVGREGKGRLDKKCACMAH